MRHVIERATATSGIAIVSLSCALTDGNAKKFYERFGFQDTGKVRHGEMEMVLPVR